jgi:hypothetical protein
VLPALTPQAGRKRSRRLTQGDETLFVDVVVDKTKVTSPAGMLSATAA